MRSHLLVEKLRLHDSGYMRSTSPRALWLVDAERPEGVVMALCNRKTAVQLLVFPFQERELTFKLSRSLTLQSQQWPALSSSFPEHSDISDDSCLG